MPSFSRPRPPVGRKPAVSMTCSGCRRISILLRIASRVVPGDRRHDRDLFADELIRAGSTCPRWPGRSARRRGPSRSRLPCRARADDSPRAASRSARACLPRRPRAMNSMSSSGKSSVASVNIRSSIKRVDCGVDLAREGAGEVARAARARRSSSRRRSGRPRLLPARDRACR